MTKELNNYNYFAIIDLEATCCDNKTIPRQEMEIIEIGAVMVEQSSLHVKDEYQTFIKPIRHPKLTEFCTTLTTITDADLISAPDYTTAIEHLKNWLSQFDKHLFCSWGDYDKNQFNQDSRFHDIPYPFGTDHLNIKKLFSKQQKLNKNLGMAQALRMANIPLDGTHHRGIDDARNMAKLMPFIVGDKYLNQR